MAYRPSRDLAASTVWAIVVTILGFLGFLAFLINSDKTAEVRSLLILIGQGFVTLMNIWIVYRSTQTTNQRVDTAVAKVDTVREIAEDVKQTVNGNTPQPGTIPKVQP